MIDSDQFPTINAQSMSGITSVDQQPKRTMTGAFRIAIDELPPTEDTTTTHHDYSLYKPLLLHAEIYHTSTAGMSGGELEKHSLSDDAVIIQGRPDFSQIFSRINEFVASRGEGRIGVSICGPDVMVIDATKACRELKQDSVKWDTHFEVFNIYFANIYHNYFYLSHHTMSSDTTTTTSAAISTTPPAAGATITNLLLITPYNVF